MFIHADHEKLKGIVLYDHCDECEAQTTRLWELDTDTLRTVAALDKNQPAVSHADRKARKTLELYARIVTDSGVLEHAYHGNLIPYLKTKGFALFNGCDACEAIIASSDLCDQQTIADRAGVSLAAVRKWRQRYDAFPSAVLIIGGSPAFSWTAVSRWLMQTGRS